MLLVFGGVLSYLVAFLIDVYHITLMTKDYMEQGYKIKYKEYKNNLGNENFNLRYIPYLTLVPAIKSLVDYNKNRDNIVRRNIFNGSVQILTDKEKEAYLKKNGI